MIYSNLRPARLDYICLAIYKVLRINGRRIGGGKSAGSLFRRGPVRTLWLLPCGFIPSHHNDAYQSIPSSTGSSKVLNAALYMILYIFQVETLFKRITESGIHGKW